MDTAAIIENDIVATSYNASFYEEAFKSLEEDIARLESASRLMEDTYNKLIALNQ